ncbi:hypothetical protein GOBAR_AA02608 [Gossypium barbadense]|uniref:DUF4283 domain-containing protein n=1 Tax=Gossypium barbadense TaxID=3634 RepID=A0A2P5YQX7_GOSBA|nr:hypothetical protein GOBAR_AA02608 [Gossypium barbadense]
MDIENGYYLAKFHNPVDFERVLSQGPWIAYGQYLTVQPWSIEFNPSQHYPNMVMAWILLPRLPGHMYKKKILWEIRGIIRRVAKLDFNTNNGVRGKFARIAVYVNLGKAFTSQNTINGAAKEKIQRSIQLQPLENLNDKLGSHENRTTKETHTTQKESGPTAEYTTTPTGSPPTSQFQQRPGTMEVQTNDTKQIAGEIYGTQSGANLVSHPSHCFTTDSLLEVAVIPSNGVLDPTKHSAVRFKEAGTLREK